MPSPPAICCAVLRQAPDAILVTDDTGRIVMVNEATLRLFGFREEELVGHFIERLVPEAARGPHLTHRQRWVAHPNTRQMRCGELIHARRSDGTTFAAEIRLSAVEAEGRLWPTAIVRDVTEREQERERLRYLGSHDGLTGLFNRTFYDAEKARLERGREQPISVMVLDVDGLKDVNDQHGHAEGDRLLKRLAAVLRSAFREEDVVARVGGDEFAVLLPNLDAEGRLAARARFFADLARHNELERHLPVVVSVGGATAPNGHALAMAARLADVRMYEQKHARRGRGATSPAH